jgi:hypothetical protein
MKSGKRLSDSQALPGMGSSSLKSVIALYLVTAVRRGVVGNSQGSVA